jgi:hypothetical protein
LFSFEKTKVAINIKQIEKIIKQTNMEIIDKDVLYLVLGFCWPQDFSSLARSCKRVNSFMKEQRFLLRLFHRFWPETYTFSLKDKYLELSDGALYAAFIGRWNSSKHCYIIYKDAWYPIELVRSVKKLDSIRIEIYTRAECSYQWKFPGIPTTNTPFNFDGRAAAILAFETVRRARRILSTTLEGGDITAASNEIFFHRATLLKPLVSFPGKRIVYPVGTRIDLIIFKKEKWIDFCTVKHGDKVSSLMIGTEFILKGLK